MKVVIDASVVVKWLLPDPEREYDLAPALGLLRDVRARRVRPVQPPHWLAEVASVVTRLKPTAAASSLLLLDAMDLPVAGDLSTYQRASDLAASLRHHLFDTLYHAVALEIGASLVTADEHYERKARHLGSITLLSDWGQAVHSP